MTTSLKRSGFAVGQIHGDMDQSERIAEFDRFKNDEINILVASDVAARGLDVKGVSHVFNFDVPWQPDDYVHRIGRTGRAGATGIAITLATREDARTVAAIEKLTGTKIARVGAEGEGRPERDEVEQEGAMLRQRMRRSRGRGAVAASAANSPRADRKAKEPAGDDRKAKEPAGSEPAEDLATDDNAVPETESSNRSSRPRTRSRGRKADGGDEGQRPPVKPDQGEAPVADDLQADWNGPMPSFLTVSAG